MGASQPNAWSRADREHRPPKIEPWILFGGCLIVTVASVLFGVGTWIVRSNQTGRALERADELALALQEANREMDEAVELARVFGQRTTEAARENESLSEELRIVNAELASARRKRDVFQSAIKTARDDDARPANLTHASLLEAVGGLERVVASASVTDKDGRSGVSEGASIEFLKQDGRIKCGFEFSERGDTGLELSIIVATSVGGSTAISVSLRLVKAYKVPGESRQYHVTLWQRHSVGLCGQAQAPVVAESLVGGLVDDLAQKLQAPQP